MLLSWMFQFTPALRRATARPGSVCLHSGFQFTPALRRATRKLNDSLMRASVSIHARLATGDPPTRSASGATTSFQFTPALRRATRNGFVLSLPALSFNSRPPCDGRPSRGRGRRGLRESFNSRPPCDGRHTATAAPPPPAGFNSRPPCDGRRSCSAWSAA